MIKSILCFMLFLGAMSSTSVFAMGKSRLPDPEVVANVDLNRYMGKWYEAAHSPNFFQKKCVHSTAEYQMQSDGSVSVYNVCYKANGKTKDISGYAVVVDPAVTAKLRVRFNIFARGEYWITHLDPNYEWAVVSSSGKRSIFILSRTAPMNPEVLSGIIAQLKSEGYDTDHLIFDRY